MALEHKTFAMSMYANQTDLFKAKSEYYMNEAEKLQMELEIALAAATDYKLLADERFKQYVDLSDKMRANEESNSLEVIGHAIMNGKNNPPKIHSYRVTTGMGKLHSDRNKLSFLTIDELDELDSIGYSGKTLDGKKNERSTYLNSLGKGTFTIECIRSDNGDFSAEYLIVRTI